MTRLELYIYSEGPIMVDDDSWDVRLEDKGDDVGPIGLILNQNGDTMGVSLSPENAIKIRDWLSKWLAENAQ